MLAIFADISQCLSSQSNPLMIQWITAKPSTMPRQGSVRIPLCASQPSLPRIWKIRLSSPWVAGSYCSWNRWALDFSEVGATWEVKEMNKSTGRRSGPLMYFLQRKERFSKRPTVPLSWHLNQLLFCLVIPGEGLCLIIENVENEVDPMLDPVLDKQIIKKGSLVQRSWLRWGILKDQVTRRKLGSCDPAQPQAKRFFSDWQRVEYEWNVLNMADLVAALIWIFPSPKERTSTSMSVIRTWTTRYPSLAWDDTAGWKFGLCKRAPQTPLFGGKENLVIQLPPEYHAKKVQTVFSSLW